MDTNDMRTISRNTQGVRLLRLDEGDKVASVVPVVPEEEGSENEQEDDLLPGTDNPGGTVPQKPQNPPEGTVEGGNQPE